MHASSTMLGNPHVPVVFFAGRCVFYRNLRLGVECTWLVSFLSPHGLVDDVSFAARHGFLSFSSVRMCRSYLRIRIVQATLGPLQGWSCHLRPARSSWVVCFFLFVFHGWRLHRRRRLFRSCIACFNGPSTSSVCTKLGVVERTHR